MQCSIIYGEQEGEKLVGTADYDMKFLPCIKLWKHVLSDRIKNLAVRLEGSVDCTCCCELSVNCMSEGMESFILKPAKKRFIPFCFHRGLLRFLIEQEPARVLCQVWTWQSTNCEWIPHTRADVGLFILALILRLTKTVGGKAESISDVKTLLKE